MVAIDIVIVMLHPYIVIGSVVAVVAVIASVSVIVNAIAIEVVIGIVAVVAIVSASASRIAVLSVLVGGYYCSGLLSFTSILDLMARSP